MKVSTRNIREIRRRLDILYRHFHIDPAEENVCIGDEHIYIAYPDDDEEHTFYCVDDFMRYTEDLDNIRVIGNHSVVCGNTRQTIIKVDGYYYNSLVPHVQFETEYFSLRIVDIPFLIGIIASRDGIYNEDFGVLPCSSYMAVELVFKDGVKIEEETCVNTIKQCLYYIACNYNVPISIGEFMSWDDLYDEECEISENPLIIQPAQLSPYCRAMEYYISGLMSDDAELSFLFFYKVIEYFAPSAYKRTTYEQLNQKIDELQSVDKCANDFEEIIRIVGKYKDSIKDNRLTQTVLECCVSDMTRLRSFLPDALSVQLGNQNIIKEIADIIYSTRNNIVHAKSNYSSTRKECPGDILDDLNVFMSELCKHLIEWNSRQPREFQLR